MQRAAVVAELGLEVLAVQAEVLRASLPRVPDQKVLLVWGSALRAVVGVESSQI